MAYTIYVVDPYKPVVAAAEAVLGAVLPRMGITDYEVSTFSDGVHLLDASKTKKPQMIIIGRSTPFTSIGSGGKDLIAMLRQSYGGDLAIIAMSAISSYREQLLDAGADSFLEKPFSIGSLEEAIRQATGRERQ